MDCPHHYFVRDKDGRLPIHIALETGMKHFIGLDTLINTDHAHLGDLDTVTTFCPSELTAVEPTSDLDIIYHLLPMHPNHAERGIDDSKKQKRVVLVSSSMNKKNNTCGGKCQR